MIERGLEPEFSPKLKRQLETIRKPASPSPGMKDLRKLLWCSIDNDDSRDLDQLTVGEALEDGRVRILVAIADVDALVRKSSAIDAHAAQNTTSVYTPGMIFPMLPEALSTDLTSLNEGEERVAIVTDMIFGADGILKESSHYPARVCNRAQLAYRGVGSWLAGEGSIPQKVTTVPGLEENLRLQDGLAKQLSELREHRGSLNLQTIEPRAVFEGDAIKALEILPRNPATRLIEEFMIAANGAVAVFLGSVDFPSFRRVLRSPDRWERIVKLAAGLGGELPELPDSAALEEFLEQRREAEPAKFPDLSLAIVKLIGRGEYALNLPGEEPPGHFALSVRDYTHSTAPNRRFPDLIIQRLLKAALAGEPVPYSLYDLSDLARHCTNREDDATKIERRMRKSAAALLLADRIGDSFDAIISGASDKGTWVRLFDPPIEGRLERGYKGLDVGDRLRVTLTDTDVERGYINFVRE